FESLLETRANEENAGNGPYAKYEVLNFAVGGYSVLQQLWLLEHKVVDFEPDAVLLASHFNDGESAIRHLASSIRAGVYIPYEYLHEMAAKAGVDRNTPAGIAEKRLQPYSQDILSWVYGRIAQECRKRGAHPIWVYVVLPGMEISRSSLA